MKDKSGNSVFRSVFTLVVLILMFLSLPAHAQSFDFNNVVLIKTGISSRGLKWGDGTVRDCQKIFGKPSSVENFYSEIDEDTLQLLNYGKNKLYFDKGIFRTFDLVDAFMSVGDSKGNIFKIGDKMKTKNGVKTFFDFKLNETPGNSWNLDFETSANAYLKRNGLVMDSGIGLLFDKNDTLFYIGIWD
ncbi:hypothetical protein L0657_02545 [Dyadobacter sp. CY345]|uniref:hypothetical protein n=1 Tax=Dyadobacter sp. CY345 TaxID=2909335 RepID=UPI001F1B8311|nr:hypothetical protein [Dyadobacter sp. CY345]MCF2442820.1 hypothetical protein [Dyadobacter sp. CY345]